MASMRMTMGYIRKIRQRSAPVVKPIRCRHCEVPMVLGMISAKIRMSSVIRADTQPNHSAPKSRVACRPTPAAPMVLAMVLRARMAASGRALSSLYSRKRVAGL